MVGYWTGLGSMGLLPPSPVHQTQGWTEGRNGQVKLGGDQHPGFDSSIRQVGTVQYCVVPHCVMRTVNAHIGLGQADDFGHVRE